jgi:hypothetical protein
MNDFIGLWTFYVSLFGNTILLVFWLMLEERIHMTNLQLIHSAAYRPVAMQRRQNKQRVRPLFYIPSVMHQSESFLKRHQNIFNSLKSVC